MTLAEQIALAKLDYEDVHTAGKGKGRQAEWSDFWDTFQSKGSRRAYIQAFMSTGWTNDNFRPKYNVIMTGSAQQVFANTRITNIKQCLEQQGVVLDTSGATALSQAFQNARSTHIPTVDATSCPSYAVTYTFNSSYIKEIEKFVVIEEHNLADTFAGASALTTIVIDGTIGKNVSFSSSPLNVESMKSVINHLKNYAGTSNDGTYKVTFSTARWTALEASGSAPDGGTWKDYVVYTLGWAI